MSIVLFDGVAYGMLLFLISIGLSITLGLMKFVNLAHGTFAMIGGYTASYFANRFGMSFPAVLLLGTLSGIISSGLLEIIFFRFLYKRHPLDQVLLSIGIIFVSIATATYFFGSSPQPFNLPTSLQGQVSVFGEHVGKYRLFLIIFGICTLIAIELLFSKTRFGAMVRAAVDNQRITQSLGINVKLLFLATFALGGGLAGLGGALSLGILSLEPSFPLRYLVYFLIVVCVGGAGSIIGPFIAALLLGLVDVAGKYYLPEAGAFFIYVFMLLVLIIRPHGLVPHKGLV